MFPNFFTAFDNTEGEFLRSRGGRAKALTRELLEEKVALGTDAGCMAVVVSYMEHRTGMKGARTNWDRSTTIAVLSNFRAAGNNDRSQIATATLTLPRNKSTRKYNTMICITIHWLLAEKIEAWNGIVYVKVVGNIVELFFARNDTERNTVSVITYMCTVFHEHACIPTKLSAPSRTEARTGAAPGPRSRRPLRCVPYPRWVRGGLRAKKHVRGRRPSRPRRSLRHRVGLRRVRHGRVGRPPVRRRNAIRRHGRRRRRRERVRQLRG